jgi:hypothetical protein
LALSAMVYKPNEKEKPMIDLMDPPLDDEDDDGREHGTTIIR